MNALHEIGRAVEVMENLALSDYRPGYLTADGVQQAGRCRAVHSGVVVRVLFKPEDGHFYRIAGKKFDREAFIDELVRMTDVS